MIAKLWQRIIERLIDNFCHDIGQLMTKKNPKLTLRRMKILKQRKNTKHIVKLLSMETCFGIERNYLSTSPSPALYIPTGCSKIISQSLVHLRQFASTAERATMFEFSLIINFLFFSIFCIFTYTLKIREKDRERE